MNQSVISQLLRSPKKGLDEVLARACLQVELSISLFLYMYLYTNIHTHVPIYTHTISINTHKDELPLY